MSVYWENFIEGLRVERSGDDIQDYQNAAEKMNKFLKTLGNVLKTEEIGSGAIDLNPDHTTKSRSAAVQYLQSKFSYEFDISPLQGRQLDSEQFQVFAQQINAVPQPEPKEPKEPNPPPAPVIDIVKFLIDKKDLIGQVAKCIGQGEWKTRWWGWEVGISQDCANKTAELLTGAGAGASLKVWLAIAAAMQHFVQTGVFSIILDLAGFSGVLTIVGLYAFALGLLIKRVNHGAGVWIQGNWPWPLPFVSFPYVWAIPG